MLFWLNLTLCVIQLYKPVLIQQYSDSSLIVNLERRVVRLKKHIEFETGYRVETTATLYPFARQIQLRIAGVPLCVNLGTSELIGCNKADISMRNTLFDIVTQNNGYYIKQNNRCLTRAEFDNRNRGFVIRLNACRELDTQIWDFADLELTPDEVKEAEMVLVSGTLRKDYFRNHLFGVGRGVGTR